ncbi:MAG: AbrB/MazE/SpoVT family DNA-binding domain-containing protein [Proteobacteria bacterium]|nr:MAG: AbrB/MazE/SpoVT family DNA-binding domain-containing protein [Pseudomonadota bacterium]
MRSALKKHGNSRGITIPPALLEQLGWTEGTQLDLEVKDGRLVAYPLAPTLDALLASFPDNYQAEEEDWGKDVGKEVIE